jgi:alpha-glucosidase
MMRWLVIAAVVACSNPPPPVEVAAGRLTARIESEPARITLLVDGAVAWQTEAGDGDGMHGFASVSTKAVMIDELYGSYRFVENKQTTVWRPIGKLAAVTPTDDGATFDLYSDDNKIGTGRLQFVTATRSGADPDAAGYPRHVRIALTVDTGDSVSLSSTLAADEHVVGMGGQSFDVDEHGQHVPLWVQEDGIQKFDDADDNYQGVWFLQGRRHSTHTPMPMLLSSRNYALAVDTNARAVFDLGAEQSDAARFEAWERTLDVQVFVGTDARDALGHMIAWTGKPERPPEAIFAPWVDAIFGSASVRQVAQALRANGVAASVIWTEDWRGGADDAFGYTLAENWRVSRALYPDFEQLAGDLHGDGFQFLVYHNTFVDSTADVFADATAGGYPLHDASGGTYMFDGVKFDPATLLDLTNPDALAWGKSVMTEAVALGADGWMADFGEWEPIDAKLASGETALAVHNRYPVDWARMNHDMLAQPLAGRPPPIYFMRSAWLHSQPLAQVMWGGDQQTDWSDGDGFPSVIPIGLGLGLAGFPYFGSDIGGYMSEQTVPTTEELFYRWVTLGAFSPVMRTHHGKSAHATFQWQHDANSIAHFARWTRFHQQLAAYLGGSIGSFERDGLPLFRLAALEFPGEPWAWTALDEYLLGDRILVAPIEVQGATSRSVELPASTSWYPLFGGDAVAGGTITASAAMTDIPVYVPAGTLLVLYAATVETVLPAPALPATGTLTSAREVWLYPGDAVDPARATWHDTLGPATTSPQWTWSGRPAGAGVPTTALFAGAAVAVATTADYATIVVTGDGALTLGGGGTLTIARGDPAATTTIRVYR